MNIKKEEIQKASEESRHFDGLFPNWTDKDIWDGGFEKGVKWCYNQMNEKIIVKLEFNYADEFDTDSLWITSRFEFKEYIEKLKKLEDVSREFYFGTNEYIEISPKELIESLTILGSISETTYNELTNIIGYTFGMFSIDEFMERFEYNEE